MAAQGADAPFPAVVDATSTVPKAEPNEPEDNAGLYVGKRAVRGAQNSIKSEFEAGEVLARKGVEGIPESLLRMFAPRDWVDKVLPPGGFMDPNVEVKDKLTGQTTRKPLSARMREASDELVGSIKIGDAPGAVSRTFGAMAEGFGAWAGNPFGGPRNLAKGALMALGAGAGSEYGGMAGRSLGGTVGGEKGAEIGESAGQVIGGAVGAQANVMRGKVIGAGAKAAGLATETGRSELEANLNDQVKKLHPKVQSYIQEHVNTEVAKSMSRDPNVLDKISELEAAQKRLGAESIQFDLAQRTDNSSVKEAYKRQQPRDLKEAQDLQGRALGQQSAIKDIYNEKIGGPKPDAKSIESSMDDYRKTTNIIIGALEADKQAAKDALPHLGPERKTALGGERDRLYEAQKDAARPVRDSWYAQIRLNDALSPTNFDLKGVGKETRALLGQALTALDKSTIPEPVMKLAGLIKKSEGTPAKTERVTDAHGISKMEVVDKGTKPEPITVDDMLDITKALNRVKPKDAIEARNLALVRDEVEKAWKQAPDEVYGTYKQAQENYKNLYAPMFREGVNGNVDKRAPSSRPGEDYYLPDKGYDPWLKKDEITSRMENFDNLFGGQKMGRRVEQAYRGLAQSIQDRYYKEVFGGSDKFNQAKHDNFMEDYKPVFDRVPFAREAIERQAAAVLGKEGEIAQQHREFGETMRSPLNRAIGVQQANRLISRALESPEDMNRLVIAMRKSGGAEALLNDITRRINVMQNGKFDPDMMAKVVKDGASGLQVLYTKIYGPAKAEEMLQNLRDIALLGKRAKIMELKNPPAGMSPMGDPIKGTTGSNLASWVSYLRGHALGYQSAPYLGVVAGGRYFNARMQNALIDAEQRAFNDPDMSAAVLEMYTKSAGEPVTPKTWRTIFSASRVGGATAAQRLFDWAVDRGYVLRTMGKGASIGATTNRNRDRERNPE